MKHVLPLPSLDEYLDRLKYKNELERQQVKQAVDDAGFVSVMDLAVHDRIKLEKRLKTTSESKHIANKLAVSFFRPPLDMEEMRKREPKRVKLNHVFEFSLNSGMLHELTATSDSRLLQVLQVLMEHYRVSYDHDVLYVDTNHTHILLNPIAGVDVCELQSLDEMYRLFHALDSGKYGFVVINNLTQLMDFSFPGVDMASYSLRAMELQSLMHRLKLYALRMNLIILYINEFGIMLDYFEDNRAKLELIARGGNIINYAPHNRIHLYAEDGVIKAEVRNSSYLPSKIYDVRLPMSVVDDIF